MRQTQVVRSERVVETSMAGMGLASAERAESLAETRNQHRIRRVWEDESGNEAADDG